MNETQAMLFAIQRFQLLALYTSSSAQSTVTSGYAFAWSESVYPLLNRSAVWHQAFEKCFAVSREHMHDLYDFLTTRWAGNKPLTFFELEDQYGIRGPRRPGPLWDQASLVAACRYLHLQNEFDQEFWTALLGNSQSPPEAERITRKFDADDVFFE